MNQQDFALLIGHRLVLDALGDDVRFSYLERHIPITEIYCEISLVNKEEFTGVSVPIPDKFSLNLRDFNVAIV